MKNVISLIIGIIGIIVVVVLQAPHKDSVESLVMPGPLSLPHAKFETECSKCHYDFKKASQNALCLDCHKDVAQDLKGSVGLHGHIENIEVKQCKTCHAEHKGREFDMVRLDKETFKHESTGFELKGAHARLSLTCEACHVKDKKFREAPQDCFSCHAKDDHHAGQLGKSCKDCHNESQWKNTYFDHGKTHFPLTGKHQQVLCNACHINEIYKITPKECVSCHLVNDIHDSPKVEQCERCHNTAGWKEVAYDHNVQTKFALLGQHGKIKCSACHASNVFKTKVGTQCVDCHKVDDAHKGKNGSDCQKCHTSLDQWKKVGFDHNRDTRFQLVNGHAKVQCDACHRESSKDMKIAADCYSCHKAEDVHKGQEGTNCASCHNDKGWRDGIKFDHDTTGFPLIGQHAVTACGECHQSSAFKDTKTSCVACHLKDDTHKKTLGTACAQCHNPNGWKLWQFDHDKQTKYKLEGPHAGIKCQSCHKLAMDKQVTASTQCYDCHEEDDVHKGQFGEHCEQCHAVDTFKHYTIGREP